MKPLFCRLLTISDGEFFRFLPGVLQPKNGFLRVMTFSKLTENYRKCPFLKRANFRLTTLPIGEAVKKSPPCVVITIHSLQHGRAGRAAASALPIGLGNIPSDYKTRSERSGDAPAGCMRFFTNQR